LANGGTNTISVHNMDTAFNGAINLNGGSGADTFDLHALGTYTGTITITGNGGADTYQFGNNWGTAVAAGPPPATLDFTNVSNHPVQYDGTTYTDTPGTDQVTFTGTKPGHIDVSLSTTGVGANFDKTGEITNVVNKLKDVVTAVDNAVSALSTTIPLL